MSEPKIRRLPTEVQLALEVMPCQAVRRTHEPGATPHPCSYFAEWGSYHSYDYAALDPPNEPTIKPENPFIYVGKTALVPEILSGCRKAPIMSVGINPNLPGYWPASRNALNPLFDDFLQYAHYFRYRSIAKLQMPRDAYEDLLGDRQDSPDDPTPLTPLGTEVPVEFAELKMYLAYQSVLDGLAQRKGWSTDEQKKLRVGEDISYANMVACPSARWLVNKPDPNDPTMPVMGTKRMRGIVNECFHERRYFLRQLFQSLPAVLLVFSETTGREFMAAMKGRFIKGDPQPDDNLDDLLKEEIRLGYGPAADGEVLSARVVFLPHASANPVAFEKYKPRLIDILSEEVDAGRLVYVPGADREHLARPRGGCVFCDNSLYRIGPCDYKTELHPLAPQDSILLSAEDQGEAVLQENAEQERLLRSFVDRDANKVGPTPSGAALLEIAMQPEEPAELLNIDPLDSPRFILRGRVVTMNATHEVIENGWLALASGEIVAVGKAGDQIPATFADSPDVRTEGSIYPGLLDLHNHLAYNIATLWQVPRKFEHRSQWMSNTSYLENVRLPLDTLTRDPQTCKAIIRYVEVKSLLGGTTSVQGLRSKYSLLPMKSYAGAVRNFERTDDKRLPAASGTILSIRDEVGIAAFRKALQTFPAYFYHLSEGINQKAHDEYLLLEQNDLLKETLVAIHALGLGQADLLKVKSAGGKVVWSPLSNVLLYGKTIDAKILSTLKVPFALGCDWSPSGSKNILEELKVAWLTTQADGATLTYEDLCVAVTVNAARAVGWQGAVGSIAPGKYADLVVIKGENGDPWERLVRATEREVRLVVVAGYARYGDKSVMESLGLPGNQLEPLTVGGQPKRLHLFREDDPLANLSFRDAVATLRKSMSRLRELDAELTASPFELTSGDEQFLLALDNEDPLEFDLAEAELLAAAELPESIELDVPTVIDDPDYFARLQAIKHLPDALKDLGDFYQ